MTATCDIVCTDMRWRVSAAREACGMGYTPGPSSIWQSGISRGICMGCKVPRNGMRMRRGARTLWDPCRSQCELHVVWHGLAWTPRMIDDVHSRCLGPWVRSSPMRYAKGNRRAMLVHPGKTMTSYSPSLMRGLETDAQCGHAANRTVGNYPSSFRLSPSSPPTHAFSVAITYLFQRNSRVHS